MPVVARVVFCAGFAGRNDQGRRSGRIAGDPGLSALNIIHRALEGPRRVRDSRRAINKKGRSHHVQSISATAAYRDESIHVDACQVPQKAAHR
ncbi:MAG TPA: hypothetical protein VLT92_17610, partial [Burkholderiales bacterium]|nr:hypothetical protein [Burkholderiales bacterium]